MGLIGKIGLEAPLSITRPGHDKRTRVHAGERSNVDRAMREKVSKGNFSQQKRSHQGQAECQRAHRADLPLSITLPYLWLIKRKSRGAAKVVRAGASSRGSQMILRLELRC
jgi:hypothetical protein